ncbi:MAG: signal peptidase I [Clostridiales bacterium]|nr:signal peptidase I [Clostridiales bacterium]
MYVNKILLEWVQSLIETVIIVAVLFIFCWPLKIDGRSMEPTFFSGDRVFISRFCTVFSNIENSDVIVCNIIEDGKEISILKRVIAAPYDTIRIENGQVYVNGKLLEEEYVSFNVEFDYDEATLKDGEYFVMGDNRELSYDSRYMGFIKEEDIVGKVILKWFPFSKAAVF